MGLVYKKILTGESLVGLWDVSESLEELLFISSLSAADQEKLAKKLNDTRKKEFLAVRLLLSQMLNGSHQITNDENGKPFFKSGDYETSISHSGKYVSVYLVKGKSAGIDVQKIKPDIGKGIDFFLNDDEQLWVDKTDFILINILWSAKESVYKYAGIKDLDPRNHMSVHPFSSLPQGEISVRFGIEEMETIAIHYEIFEDYVLTRTL